MLVIMRWLVVTIAIGSLVPAGRVRAAEPATAAPGATATEAPASDPAIERARALYKEGEARFATADYLKAIELWTEAFTSVPDTSDAAYIKGVLIYNLATAHEKAFEITGDISHLRQAKVLMESYATGIATLVPDEAAAEAERAKLTERLNVITAGIERWDRERARERRQGGGSPRGDDDDEPAKKGSKALIGVGAGLMGLGVVGLAVMTGGLVMGKRANDLSGLEPGDIPGRRDQFDRGRVGNGMAIGGGVAGGVLLATGAVLLGIGLARRSKNGRTAWAPMLGPRTAGLAISGRF
jgi:hypothetical protein